MVERLLNTQKVVGSNPANHICVVQAGYGGDTGHWGGDKPTPNKKGVGDNG